MSLNEFASKLRMRLFEDLKAGLTPSQGSYDEGALREARTKGDPHMGTTRYEPHNLLFEFLYPDLGSTATLVTIRVASPERIVFLPVPEWVIESIWQGDIDGSYQFESDARRLLARFEADLVEEPNSKWFGPQAPKRRE